MDKKIKLSATVITHNEAGDIMRCLDSLVGVADEIVIVDNFSSDKTLEIVRNFTNRVFLKKFESYGTQKQFALEKTSSDWVINIDADEELSQPLREEILKLKEDPGEYSGFSMPFNVFFLGKRLRFGGCSNEHHLRLFKKEKASYRGKRIHEGIIVEGKTRVLKGHVNHYTYADLEEYLKKFNQYTTLIAHEKNASGERFNIFYVFRLPVEFITRYFVKLGFLDGWHGFLYALLASYYALFKYLKLWDLQREK
ncbi:MAG: glycosyltransferase family 2 protein [bacterium]